MSQDLEPIQELPEELEGQQQLGDDIESYTLLPIDSSGEQLLFDPLTREALDGSATAEELVVYRDHLRTMKRFLTDAQHECDRRLVSAMDRNASWTVRSGGLRASAPSKAAADKEQWDDAQLYVILEELVDAGTITPEARDAAITTETVYTHKHAGIVALRKVPEVAEAIAAACTVVTVDRRVTLSGG